MKEENLTSEDSKALYQEAYLRSEAEIERIGLSDTPPKPKGFNGYLPEGISRASVSQIKEEWEKMEAFVQYVQSLRVDAKNQLTSAEETLKNKKAEIRKKKSGTKDAKDDATITDSEYVLANAAYLRKLYSYEKIVAREEMARRDIKFLSRLITANDVDSETSKQSAHISNAGTVKPRRRQWR